MQFLHENWDERVEGILDHIEPLLPGMRPLSGGDEQICEEGKNDDGVRGINPRQAGSKLVERPDLDELVQPLDLVSKTIE